MGYLIGHARIQGKPIFYIAHPYQNGRDYYATNDEGQVFLQNMSRQLGNKGFDDTVLSDLRQQIWMTRANNVEECATILDELGAEPAPALHVSPNNVAILNYDQDPAFRALRPRIGVITDTHDDVEHAKAAIELFNEQLCCCVVHCGDIISPLTLELFSGLRPGLKLYWINGCGHDNQGDNFARLREVSNRIGAICVSREGIGIGEILVAFQHTRTRIGVCHGTYEKDGVIGLDNSHTCIWSWCESKSLDYLLFGHLHYFNIKLPSADIPTVVFNSGGLYSDILKSIGVLDLYNREIELFFASDQSKYFKKGLSFDLNRQELHSDEAHGVELRELMSQERARNPKYWDYFHTRDFQAWPLVNNVAGFP